MGLYLNPVSLKKILIDGPPKLSGLKMIEWFAIFADLLFFFYVSIICRIALFISGPRGARVDAIGGGGVFFS